MQTFFPIAQYLKRHTPKRFHVRLFTLVLTLLTVASASAWNIMAFPQQSGLLSSYQLVGEPITIAGLGDNASGLTYNTSSNTLFMVVNNPEKILELSLDGQVLRTITLTGFEDTEGIAHIEGHRFVLLEERRSEVNFITITNNTFSINKFDTNSFALNIFTSSEKNLRLEGISIDHATGDIYLVKEKSPRALYKISGLLDDKPGINITIPWDIEAVNSNMSDLSGIFFEPQLRRLLVLSHESFSLSEFDLTGKHLSKMKLKRAKHALPDNIPQAEGVTLAPDGSLYIVSEPNLLYRFTSKSTSNPNNVALNGALTNNKKINKG